MWFKNLKWKYILGEIVLIFIGITLAIWFNNWNASMKLNKNKKVILAKIKEEINSNLEELQLASAKNNRILAAFKDYQKIYGSSTSEVISTPMELQRLQTAYPGFYNVVDSIRIDHEKFHYKGQTHVVLELPELTQIAWETARAINIAHEIDYECLLQMASTYNLQDRVQVEINKAAEALQKADISGLMSILNFLNQLESELSNAYSQTSTKIESCN